MCGGCTVPFQSLRSNRIDVFLRLCQYLRVANFHRMSHVKSNILHTLTSLSLMTNFLFTFTCLALLGLGCGTWSLQLQHMNSQMRHIGSSFLSRDQTQAPCIGSGELMINFRQVHLVNEMLVTPNPHPVTGKALGTCCFFCTGNSSSLCLLILQGSAYTCIPWNYCELIPDHLDKVNNARKLVTWIFWFPSAYKSYVYTTLQSIKCAMALCLNTVHIKNTLLLKKGYHHLRLQ